MKKLKFDEKFKPCRGNDLLDVSQYGRVRLADTEIILRQIEIDNHYFVENPKKPGNEGAFEKVHRLVALTWLGDDYDKSKEVHHINFNSYDNRVDNLKWLDKGTHEKLHEERRKEQKG